MFFPEPSGGKLHAPDSILSGLRPNSNILGFRPRRFPARPQEHSYPSICCCAVLCFGGSGGVVGLSLSICMLRGLVPWWIMFSSCSYHVLIMLVCSVAVSAPISCICRLLVSCPTIRYPCVSDAVRSGYVDWRVPLPVVYGALQVSCVCDTQPAAWRIILHVDRTFLTKLLRPAANSIEFR